MWRFNKLKICGVVIERTMQNCHECNKKIVGKDRILNLSYTRIGAETHTEVVAERLCIECVASALEFYTKEQVEEIIGEDKECNKGHKDCDDMMGGYNLAKQEARDRLK